MAKATGRGGIDYPDFAQATLPHAPDVAINLVEHAVRLGSPIAFERTGALLYYDDFMYGARSWDLGSVAGGGSAITSTAFAYRGPYSIKLANDGTLNAVARLRKQYPFPYLQTAAIQFSFLTRTDFDDFNLICYIADGTTKHNVGVRVKGSAETISIYSTGAAWSEVDTKTFDYTNYYGWHVVKLVTDFVNDKYLRLMYDDEDYALSTVPIYTNTSSNPPMFSVVFTLEDKIGAAASVYVDSVIFTIDEPI